MSIELSKPLHERVYERIRDSIGDLMTDEDLKRLVDEAAQKAFFEPRIIKREGSYLSTYDTDEAWLVVELRELLKAEVQKVTVEWFADNEDKIKPVVEEVLGRGITGIITNYLENKLNGSIYDLQSKFSEALQARKPY